MACPTVELIEVFRTDHGAVLQCDRMNCYWLEFSGERTAFKVGEFLSFKKKVDAIDLEAMISDPSPGSDCAVLMTPRAARCFLLDIQGILALRELLEGAKFMISLTRTVRQGAVFLI